MFSRDWFERTFYPTDFERRISWQRIQQLQAEDVTVYPTVVRVFKSGPTFNLEGVRGTISNIDRRNQEFLIGETAPCKILAVKRDEFSDYVRLIRAETFIQLNQLAVGQLISARVRAVKPYGIWVDLGGLFGLMHRSDITPYFVWNQDLFSVDDRVSVAIADINWQLPSVRLKSPSWQGLVAEYKLFP